MVTGKAMDQRTHARTKPALDALTFALAGGLWVGGVGALSTLAALLSVPGFAPLADLLTQFYGPYGYSLSWSGVIVGAFWGFVEGFVHLGVLALLYNTLLARRTNRRL